MQSKPIAGFPSRTAACLALRAKGLTDRQIADELGLYPSDVSALIATKLRRMPGRPAREKLQAVCDELLAEGWSWAAPSKDLPANRYGWPKVDDGYRLTDEEAFRVDQLSPIVESSPTDQEGFRARETARVEVQEIVKLARIRSYTAEDKARSGCVVRVMHGGTLYVERGIIRPGTDGAGWLPTDASSSVVTGGEDEGGVSARPEAKAPEISGALAQTVSEWTTAAAANALADEPDVALRVLLAALQSYGAPARLRREGWHGLHDAMKDKAKARNPSFAAALADTLRTGMPHLKAAIAAEVARSLDLTAAAAAHPAHAVTGALPLIDALDADGYLAAARRAFDAGLYFDRAPAAVVLAAIEEMGGPKPAGKKGVIALAAADLARDLGWLPAGMRSSVYVPPRVSAPAAKAEDAVRGRRRAPAGAPASP